ncbi:MAG: MCE family protein, partial [Chitinivibrionales bacterium]|nr:MCE family protein [Chitinivibrionales bacterium]
LSFMEKWTELHVKYASTTGLNTSNDITINGIKVGHVKTMTLDDSGYVQVALKIKEKYMPLVKKDSKAKLKQKGFAVGDWEVALTMGSPGASPATAGDTLEAVLPLPLGKTITQITDMVGTIQTILTHVSEGKGSVGRILMEDSLYRQIHGITRQVTGIAAGANTTLSNFDSVIVSFSDLGKDGGMLIDSVVCMINQFEKFVVGLDTLVGNVQSVPKELSNTLNILERDLGETEIILKAIQKHWLLRKRVKKVLEESPELKQ